jgi:hypothetical protein
MFRAVLANSLAGIHKQHLVYCVYIMSVGCGTFAVSLHYTHACEAPLENEQVMLETCRGP